jgi:hypothetical protein
LQCRTCPKRSSESIVVLLENGASSPNPMSNIHMVTTTLKLES